MLTFLKQYFDSYITCTKKIDDTKIKVVKNQFWTKHFCKKFRYNEPYTNITMKELLPNLKDNSYIIDVGAHVGDTGLYLAKHLQKHYSEKNIQVCMIEPDETKIDFINKMIVLNNINNCIVFKSAVSDHKSTGRLEINYEFPGATTVVDDSSKEVDINTIDSLCKDMCISLMHIDVEGMEYECLQGSEKSLKNVQYLVIEMNEICNRYSERKFLQDNDFVHIPNYNMSKEYNNELYYNFLSEKN